MGRYWFAALVLAALAATPGATPAQTIVMKWGLENTWSYAEPPEGRAEDEDLATHRPESKARRYRTFAFKQGLAEVREPLNACIESIVEESGKYKRSGLKSAPGDGEDLSRDDFRAFVASKNPICVGVFLKTAPLLYFDFITDTATQVVLERVEVTTLEFSEYAGGGFAVGKAGYDILLSHRKGTKSYFPEPTLVFKEQRGRVTLRFWSDSFIPSVGWVGKMGEYTIDIRFVFSTAGKTVSVSTGPFKIDV